MNAKFVHHTTVSYSEVDREEFLRLSALAGLLQEVAIRHANAFDTGTRALATRGESWVLNRLSIGIDRYPRYEEALRTETWSTGITGFRGYREHRVYAGDERIASTSSLWIYVNVHTKSPVRVPASLVATFPIHESEVHHSHVDKVTAPLPSAHAPAVPVTLRYSDVDVHGHVNNTAYFEFLQTALSRTGLSPRPTGVQLKFSKELPSDIDHIQVQVEAFPACHAFSMTRDQTVYAHGQVSGTERR